jgi:hypothetical protein
MCALFGGRVSNVGVAANVNAQVALLSENVSNTADQTAQNGDQAAVVTQF